MSILEKIRSRTGLLVGIVGLALVIFILESLLGSGSALFNSSNNSVGTIAGENIDVQSFQKRVEKQIFDIQQNNPNANIDEATRQQIQQSVWDQLVNEKTVKVEYEKLGISVSDEELADIMLVHPHPYLLQQLTDRNTGKVYEPFANPDGSFNLQKLNQWVAGMNADAKKFWIQLEEALREMRMAEKYNNLIKKGIYVTAAEAKDAFIAQTKDITATYVIKRYSSVSDSTVKVTDDDLQKYYNAHQNDYKVEEATRKIEYVSFDVVPSKQDFEDIMKDADRVVSEFKTKTASEDSSYISQESENGEINVRNYTKKTMPVADSTIYTAAKGTVFGPFTEGTFVKIYKLLDAKQVADSGKVRHILLAYAGSGASNEVKRSKDDAKKLADSLLTVLKKGADFNAFVEKYSDDGGKKKPDLSNPQVLAQKDRFFVNGDTNEWKGKGGNYGWIQADSKDWVPSFVKGATENNKGDIVIVESNYGYHIMQVLDIAKTRFTQYTIAQIDKLISPSKNTSDEYYKLATDFIGKCRTLDEFNKVVEDEKLNKRLAENIRESDKNLPGLNDAKEMVKWIYQANKGDVATEPFMFENRIIVPVVTGVKNRGIAPLDEVKEDVTIKAIRDKKAEQFVAEFNSKGGTNAAEIATKMNLPLDSAKRLTFASFNVMNLGREDALIGTASALKQGATSKPTIGENGVFVVTVNAINEGPLPKDFKNKQKEMEQMNSYRVDNEIFSVLKEKAGVEDHRAKFNL